MLRAVIWDVDGTIAETERDGHRVAFNRAFEVHDLPWHWDVTTYGRLLQVAGGLERLLHDMAGRADAPASAEARDDLARRLHATKNALYGAYVEAGGVAWRPGVRRLMDACRDEGIVQAIATTTSRANVDALLRATLGIAWTRRFGAIVCAEDAPAKKPDPLVYRVALSHLGVEANEAVAIEDSPNGLQAARTAEIVTVVTRSDYFRDAVFEGASATCDDLDSPLDGAAGTVSRVDLNALRGVLSASNELPRQMQRPGP